MKTHAIFVGAAVLVAVQNFNLPPAEKPPERWQCRYYEEGRQDWWRNTFRCGPEGSGDRARPERSEKSDKPASE